MSVDQTTFDSAAFQIVAIDENTRQQIEESLNQWEDKESEARQRFDGFRAESEELLHPLSKAIRASEVLTGRDFAIRINTRE